MTSNSEPSGNNKNDDNNHHTGSGDGDGFSVNVNKNNNPFFRLMGTIVPFVLILFISFYYGHQVEVSSMATMKQLSESQTTLDRTTATIVGEDTSTMRNSEIPIEGQVIDDDKPMGKRQDQERQQQNVNQTTAWEEQQQKEQQNRPLNIIIFYADDWTMKVLGKFNQHVQTPNIDKMADNGILFTENYVTTSICWISRASFFTGTYSSRHLQLKNKIDNIFTTHPWNETLFSLLQQNGYYTGLVGKWHAPNNEKYMKQSFNFYRTYHGQHWMKRKGRRKHVTELNSIDSLNFLRHRRPINQTFALKISFFATHAIDNHYPSYEPQLKSMTELYQNVTIPVPKTATEHHWNKLPEFLKTTTNEGRKRWLKRFEPGYYQDNIKDLYRMATEVDTVVGEVIDVLKEQNVYDNTLLIFTTDNGNLHGEHGLAEKWYPFEESIRVPLVIQDPRMKDHIRGTTINKMTLNIDLTSTILGAAQIPQSSFMQGRDIADLYLDDDYVEKGKSKKHNDSPLPVATMTSSSSSSIPWRTDFFYEWNMGHPITAEGHPHKHRIDASFALITEEWKYIYWPQHDYEQLFHRSIDKYDEYDVLMKEPSSASSSSLSSSSSSTIITTNTTKNRNMNMTNNKNKRKLNDNNNGISMIQSTDEIYISMKERYTFLKQWIQSGKPAI